MALVSTLPADRAVTPLVVRCIESAPEFAALRAEWDELLRASSTSGPFLTWEWLHSWWTHLGGATRLWVLTLRDGDRLMAVAPFVLSPGSLPWFSRIEFLGTGLAGSDYLDLIVRRGAEAESLRAIAGYLTSRKVALRLDHVLPDSLAAQLVTYLGDAEWAATALPGGVCPFIRLEGHTWDSFLATLGSSHRANVRRRIKGLSQRFDVSFGLVTSDAERTQALDALVAFSEQRWKNEGGSTAFLTPAVRAFQDDATRRALHTGDLRLYVLRINGAIAGVMYGFWAHSRFYFYQHGFDEQYRPHSLGLVLTALTLQAALHEGAIEFDMLWGLEPYKFLWTRDTRPLRQIHVFPTHIGGRIHQRAVVARRHLGKLARRVLPGAPKPDHGGPTGDPCAA